MNVLKLRENSPKPTYYIMSDQPDCCPKCQTRLNLVEIVIIETECVFVNFCGNCEQEILIVEN